MAVGILRKKLPPNMATPLWLDYMDVIEEESENIKNKILEKKSLINYKLMDRDQLIDISKTLGVPIDLSVDSSIDFLKKEIASASFRIRWKASAKLYKSFFQVFKRTGIVYLYYKSGSNLIRDAKNLIGYLNPLSLSDPYYQPSTENFSGYIKLDNKLDTGLKLDEGWKLDNKTSKTNTKHIAVEVIVDKVYYSGSAGLAPALDLPPSEALAPSAQVVYLMDNSYFSYLLTNVKASRKVSEVIHVGCQLSAVVDNSRHYNSLGLSYTMPKIALNGVTTDNVSSIVDVSDIYFMEFGVGKKSLPAVGGVEPQPTALTEKLAKVEILVDEKYENSDWYGVSANYIGCLINDKLVATADGVETEFSTTLPYAPIKKGNVKISFTSGSLVYTIEDDQLGNFIGTNGEGTINYETGLISISTNIYYETNEVLGLGTGSQTSFSYTTLSYPIKTSSIIITYIINGTTYVAIDNGYGTITGIQCTGTINYTSGAVSIAFSQAPSANTQILIKYKYEKTTIPDNGTKISAEYYFTSSTVNITEAGVTDINGNLLAYATFPQLQFSDFNTHLSMNFLVKKTNF